MIIGPKYKKARYLGAPIFEKTQSQKFSQSLARKQKADRPRQKTDYGLQMLEKQKARFTYYLTEKQFSKYIKNAMGKSTGNPSEKVFVSLETRLDNVMYRTGIVQSRLAGRQMVSHGHVMVNGKRVTIPSFQVSLGDKITIREGSLKKPLFATLSEKVAKALIPSWLKMSKGKTEWEVQGEPKYVPSEHLFNIAAVLEFYSR